MAAYEVLLLNTAVPQIQAAQSGDTYVVPRDIAFSAALTLSAGTANGVPYLNGSKVLTTGSALTFDGTNLGLGVTPSAWSGLKAFEIAGTGSSLASATNNNMFLSANAWYNGTGWRYGITAEATQYQQFAGAHKWFTAGSGTAGNAITFTQAMTLDASENLGIGTSSPTNRLHVVTSGTSLALFSGAEYSQFNISGGSQNFYIQNYNSVSIIGTKGASPLLFTTNEVERARITSVGNFKIGGTADRATTEGTNQLVLFNGTAPVGTLTNGVSFYSESGEARVMDAAGNSTLLSPHDTATNEWIFHSKHTPTGKVLRIDVERLLKFVNDHFGLDAVHEFIEE